MGKIGIVNAAALVFRGSKQFQVRPLSKLATPGQVSKSGPSINEDKEINGGETATWVPHPRTGIFFPAGQERVMDDVPDGAASFAITFWLRNVDGVDKADPDDPPLHSNDIPFN